jgi:hypothetical protein
MSMPICSFLRDSDRRPSSNKVSRSIRMPCTSTAVYFWLPSCSGVWTSGDRALGFLMLNPEKVTNPDQCALNHVINGNYLVLDARWNGQDAMVGEQSYKDTVIIHFNGDRKPWHYMCLHPQRAHYIRYLEQTEWKNYSFPDRSLMNFAKRALRDRVPWIVDLRRKV